MSLKINMRKKKKALEEVEIESSLETNMNVMELQRALLLGARELR